MTKIGLDRNELPYAPTMSAVFAGTQEMFDARRYPSWDALELRTSLAGRFGVERNWVVAASGSISVIQQTMLAAGPGEVVFSWPSFDAFPPLATALRMRLRLAGLRPDGSCDLADMRTKITGDTRLIILCTPNTPTGGAVRHGDLAEFLADVPADVMVLIDEAYAEFVEMEDAVRAIELIRRHDNVAMSRTFSKAYGLAGLRVGYGIAQPRCAAAIAEKGVPYALSRPAEAAAVHALRATEYMRTNVAKVNAERSRLAVGLRRMGMRVVCGHGNFVWVPVEGDLSSIARSLAAAGIYVKTYPAHGIRVTIGTPEQTERVLAAWPRVHVDSSVTGTDR